jgi:hypothetical protein
MGKVTFATPSGYAFGNAPGMPRVCLIGRSRECNFRLPAGQISRQHLLLRVDDDGNVFVRDLGSRNGTFVNEEPVPMFIQPEGMEDLPPAGTPIGNERLVQVGTDRLTILSGADSAPEFMIEPFGDANAEYGQGYMLKFVQPAS